jgi:hypothetical protein
VGLLWVWHLHRHRPARPPLASVAPVGHRLDRVEQHSGRSGGLWVDAAAAQGLQQWQRAPARSVLPGPGRQQQQRGGDGSPLTCASAVLCKWIKHTVEVHLPLTDEQLVTYWPTVTAGFWQENCLLAIE